MRTSRLLPPLAITLSLFLVTAVCLDALAQDPGLNQRHGIRRVLLVSIDGMHAVDYLNCSQGVSGVNAGQPYCPNLAKLGQTAVNYLDTSTSRPSDSFPGLMTIVSGATPRLRGAFYDVATPLPQLACFSRRRSKRLQDIDEVRRYMAFSIA